MSKMCFCLLLHFSLYSYVAECDCLWRLVVNHVLYLHLQSKHEAVRLSWVKHVNNNPSFSNRSYSYWFLPVSLGAVFSGRRCGFWTIITVTSPCIILPCLTCPSPSSPKRRLPSKSITWEKVKITWLQFRCTTVVICKLARKVCKYYNV